jgi:nitrite reductase/ring-hydroxylating ferredoxin subunit
MREINVGPVTAFADLGRKLIESGGLEVGIFRLGNDVFAYENVCPHIGGPACQGKIIAKVEELIAEDRTSLGMAFSKTVMNIVCPWHAFEFDIRTGRHNGNPRYRLKPIKVRVQDGDVIVSLPDEKKDQNVTVKPTADGPTVRPVF